MTSRLIFPLCLCCAVLCAFVGYMSKRAIKEAEQVTTAVVELDCGMFLEKRPKESTGVLLSDYVFVNRVAAIDTDDDEKWDDVAVALFPKGGFTFIALASRRCSRTCTQYSPENSTIWILKTLLLSP